MTLEWSFILVFLLIGLFGYGWGQVRARKTGDRVGARMHSQPLYHGWFAALCLAGPGLIASLIATVIAPASLEDWSEARFVERGERMLGSPEFVVQTPVLRERLNAIDVTPQSPRADDMSAQSVFRATPELADHPDRWAALIAACDPANRLRWFGLMPEIPDFERAFSATRRDTEQIWHRSFVVMVVALAVFGFFAARSSGQSSLRARVYVERTLTFALGLCALVAVMTTFGIVLTLASQASRFFLQTGSGELGVLVGLGSFLTGSDWSLQGEGQFGVLPLLSGTLLLTLIAMLVAVPIGLKTAICLSEYVPERLRIVAKPVLELLAAVPTVIYGFVAAVFLGPLIRDVAHALSGLGIPVLSPWLASADGQSALAAGLIMGLMIVPFVSSLSLDAIQAVPKSLRDAGLAMGATPSEVMRQVVVPAALPGITGAFLLGLSRAIGETMIVLMAAGLAADLTFDPLQSVTSMTAKMVEVLIGEFSFESTKALSAFALGSLLFVITFAVNLIALGIVRRYRLRYE